MSTRSLSVLPIAAFLLSLPVPGADWPQYRGPQHNGISSERIAKWPDVDPKLLWKAPLNAGFSSITVANGIASTLILRNSDGVAREHVIAMDANTGKEFWATPL